jgi:hypothetical protein
VGPAKIPSLLSKEMNGGNYKKEKKRMEAVSLSFI